jgi:hypothetical protein
MNPQAKCSDDSVGKLTVSASLSSEANNVISSIELCATSYSSCFVPDKYLLGCNFNNILLQQTTAIMNEYIKRFSITVILLNIM